MGPISHHRATQKTALIRPKNKEQALWYDPCPVLLVFFLLKIKKITIPVPPPLLYDMTHMPQFICRLLIS